MPPQPSGEYDDRVRRFLKGVDAAPKRVLLISTTGVYGDCGGRWIDESEPLKPLADRAKRRADAENVVQEWAARFGGEIVILRVPGIYAPDRLPLERLRRGEPVLHEQEAPWTNRIHADDLAMVCKRAMEVAPPGSIYNATDGHPSTMTDYFNQVADFAGLPRPPQISMAEAQTAMSAGMLSYLQESRRIGNEKLLRELGVNLRYPSLADGLR
jgi:nucleoside-diphosphate-sugar epimerase